MLKAVEQGDPKAAEQLLPLVYDELRRLAALERQKIEDEPAHPRHLLTIPWSGYKFLK